MSNSDKLELALNQAVVAIDYHKCVNWDRKQLFQLLQKHSTILLRGFGAVTEIPVNSFVLKNPQSGSG
jgi:hypothetical protein